MPASLENVFPKIPLQAGAVVRYRWTVFAVVIAGVSCVRYEYIPDYLTPECQNRPVPLAAAIDTATVDSALPGTIFGTVRRGDDRSGIRSARITLLDASPLHESTDSTGAFHITGVNAGWHVLVFNAIGFQSVRESVHVARSAGLRTNLSLEPQVMDGPCSGFSVIVKRKPWWKVW